MSEPLQKHSHYFRIWAGRKLDLYRIFSLFDIHDPAAQHAVKKIMFAGLRGAKDQIKDYSEAIDTLQRAVEILKEDREDNDPAQVASESNIRAERAAKSQFEENRSFVKNLASDRLKVKTAIEQLEANMTGDGYGTLLNHVEEINGRWADAAGEIDLQLNAPPYTQTPVLTASTDDASEHRFESEVSSAIWRPDGTITSDTGDCGVDP